MTDTKLTSDTARRVEALFNELSTQLPAGDLPSRQRACVAAQLAAHLNLDAETRFGAVAAALLFDGLTGQPEAATSTLVPDDFDPAGAVRAADTLERLSGLTDVARVVASRFEHFDGGGGPDGVAGDGIPLAARVLAVADFTISADPETVTRHLQLRRGVEFDPSVAEAALTLLGTVGSPHRQSPPSVATLLDRRERFNPVSPTAAKRSNGQAELGKPRGETATPRAATNGLADHHGSSLADKIDDPTSALATSMPTLAQLIDILQAAGSFDDVVALAREAALTDLGGRVVEVVAFDDVAIDAEGPGSMGGTGPGPGERVIRIDGREWGLLRVALEPAPPVDSDLDLAADAIAGALTIAERFDSLAEQALLDPLTGVGNRRVLEARLEEVFNLPSAQRSQVAMIIADMDGLKRINDTLGHEAGDQAIRLVARALIEAVTAHPGAAEAVVCRIGGDEFCAVLEGIDAETARSVATTAADVAHRLDSGVQLSCGIAMAAGAIATGRDLLRAADQAQYEAKRDRSGTVIYDNGYPPPINRDSGRRSLRDRH